MVRGYNLDWYKERLAVIEREFGADWLAEHLAPNPTGRPPVHPVPALWDQARQNIQRAVDSGQFDLPVTHADLYSLANDLAVIRALPGSSQAISLAKLRSPTYVKEGYVARIAAQGVESGYHVEFVLESTLPGEQTPDLEMSRDAFAFHIECKRRDPYLRPEGRWGEWKSLQERLLSLRGLLQTDHEVVVFAVGSLDLTTVLDAIYSQAEQVIRTGAQGEYVEDVLGCTLRIRKVPRPSLPLGSCGLFLPAWQNPGACEGQLVEASGGGLTLGPCMRAALYVIDAHKLSQVLNSYRHARPQLPKGGRGLIYIDVDTSAVPNPFCGMYLDTLAAGLTREFRRNQTNRVYAVVITGGTACIEMNPDTGVHKSFRLRRVVRNPYLEWPAGWPIPALGRERGTS